MPRVRPRVPTTQIVALFREGWTSAEIAAAVGMNPLTVRARLRYAGIVQRGKGGRPRQGAAADAVAVAALKALAQMRKESTR